MIRTPIQAPNADAHLERWVGSARPECLDRILIVGRRHLVHALRTYMRHYSAQRPHRALDLQAPDPFTTPTAQAILPRPRRPCNGATYFGGLIHEHELAAAP